MKFLNTEIEIEDMISWEPNWDETEEEPEEDLHGGIGGWRRYMKEPEEPWSFEAEFGTEDLGSYFDKYDAE